MQFRNGKVTLCVNIARRCSFVINSSQFTYLVLLCDNNCLATSSHASVMDLPTNDDQSKFLECLTEDTQ